MQRTSMHCPRRRAGAAHDQDRPTVSPLGFPLQVRYTGDIVGAWRALDADMSGGPGFSQILRMVGVGFGGLTPDLRP